MLFLTAPNAPQVQCKKKTAFAFMLFPTNISLVSVQSLVATVFQIIPELRRLRTDQKIEELVFCLDSLRLSQERLYNEINVLVYIYFFSTNAPYIALDR